jgi:S1-C subfamily serine protease
MISIVRIPRTAVLVLTPAGETCSGVLLSAALVLTVAHIAPRTALAVSLYPHT